MTQHREDRPELNPDELARLAASISNESPLEPAQVPHSGGAHLPEDMREMPVNEFDNTTLPEAVEQGHIDTGVSSPADINLKPAETAAIDQSLAARRDEPASSGEKSKRGRNIIIGSSAAALLLSGVLYFANRGGDHSSEATDPNTAPTPTATTGPSPSQPSSSESATTPSSSVLDPSIKGDITPNTQPIVGPNFLKLAKSVGDHVPYDSVNPLVDAAALQKLKASNSPPIQTFLSKYVDSPDGMAQLLNGDTTGAAQLESIYNDTYAAESQLYGQPQLFQNPDNYKLVGQLPYATHQDIQQAVATHDATGLFKKLYNGHTTPTLAYALFDNELTAGNTNVDPQKLADLMLVNNQNLDSTNPFSRESLRASIMQVMQSHLAAYNKNPDAYKSTADLFGPEKVVDAKVVGVSRQIIGQATNITDNPYYNSVKQPEITLMAVQLTTTNPQLDQKVPTEQLVVGALVPIPDGSSGNGEHLQFVTLDRAELLL
jgi:hypothetical protein